MFPLTRPMGWSKAELLEGMVPDLGRVPVLGAMRSAAWVTFTCTNCDVRATLGFETGDPQSEGQQSSFMPPVGKLSLLGDLLPDKNLRTPHL